MKLHANAALSLKGRRQLCRRVLEAGWTVSEAAAAAEVSARCAGKWVGRYRNEGELGLVDRSSAPASVPHRTSEHRVQAIAALRRLRFTGPEIAEVLGMAGSTVSGILTRIGMGKLGRVGLEPAQRYERARPGELIHIDIKKLGRIERGAGARIVGMANRGSRPKRRDAAGVDRQIAGWEDVHIAIDDGTRLAYAEVLHNHKAPTVIAFLRRAARFFARHGIPVERVLTDNGASYCSAIHAMACRVLGIRHLRTRPYRPQTNGKNRALHPDPARRLGLRRRLPHLSRANRCPRRLALVLQPPTKTLSPRPQAPDRPPQRANQPPRDLQLAGRRSGSGATAGRSVAVAVRSG